MNDKDYIILLDSIAEFDKKAFLLIRNTPKYNSISRSVKSIKKQLENFFTS